MPTDDARIEESELQRRELEAARASARALQAADAVRRDIGRHLHDHLQTLAIAAVQQLYLARRALDRDPDAASEPLDAVGDLLDQLTAELADTAHGLHVTGLESGLRPALEELARRAPVRLVIEELPDIPLGAPVETTVYMMVTEAINNAAKHARAKAVRLRARVRARTLDAEVSDDGVGGADALTGSGLLGIRDRVTLLGGALTLDSPPGGGTKLRATIPVGPERLPHRQFFLLGHEADPSVADETVQLFLSGQKTAGLSLAREWDAEGGPPALRQLMPVIDVSGRRRLTVEVVGLQLTPLQEVDLPTYRACAIEGDTVAACQARVRQFFERNRAALAVLFEEPDWRLGEDEPMLVVRHRVVALEAG